jgi:ATP-dependent phosphofructokinase / diphosphate-dependent phosphofructokinase
MRIGVLTAGGDCPGLNAVIRAVARSAIGRGDEPVGVLRGYEGLAKREYLPLDTRTVAGILGRGGTILGTSSFAPHRMDAVEEVKEAFAADRLDAVVAIGGDHTMEITRRLCTDVGLPLIGVPKTIDNDVMGTDYTVGFDTAVSIAVEAIDRIHTTAQSHNRVMVVEVMGRNAGWIAVHAGLASGADAILIPEVDLPVEALARQIASRHENGKDFSILVVAEGARLSFESGRAQEVTVEGRTDEYGYPRLGGIGAVIAQEIEERTGYEARVTVLGHMQRGGTPTPTDRILATRMGTRAYDMARQGEFGRMVAIQGGEMTSVPLSEVTGTKPADLTLLEIAKRFFG